MTLPKLETEEVPATKRFRISSRDNSDYKWQRARGVIGALEVVSEPYIRLQDDFLPRVVPGSEQIFRDALQAWQTLHGKESFVATCQKLPKETCCCGILQDDDDTKKQWVKLCNVPKTGWVDVFLKESKLPEQYGFKVDVFLWNWQNASGKAETNILLIRFFQLSSYNLRRSLESQSFEFGIIREEVGEDDDDDDDDSGNILTKQQQEVAAQNNNKNTKNGNHGAAKEDQGGALPSPVEPVDGEQIHRE